MNSKRADKHPAATTLKPQEAPARYGRTTPGEPPAWARRASGRGRRLALVSVAICAAAAVAQDFNGNAVRDSSDIRNGTSADCNRNGIPDEADLTRPDFAAAIEHYSDGTTLSNVTGLAPADVDLDGDIDLIVISRQQQNNSSVTIWRNDGGPGLVFATRHTVTNALCWTVRTADLNADGRLDVIAADAGFAQVIVMLATGPGTLGAPLRLTTGSRGTGLAVGDLDNDGDSDIAMSGFATNAVDVFRNNGNGTFAPRQSFACDVSPGAVAIGDFTGDGLADLAIANTMTNVFPLRPGTVSLLRNNGNAVFVTHATLTVAGHAETSLNSKPSDVALADIDADGDVDLLVSAKESNSLRVYSNAGDGTFANSQTLGPLEVIGGVAGCIACTNLDADPAPELAWCDSAARAVRIYDNVDGGFEYSQSYAAGSEGPVAVAAADLTGDGLPELALAGDTSYAFSTMTNEGGLNFDAVIHLRRTDGGYYQLLADFTGDGATDLASYSTFSNLFMVAPGVGNERFGASIVTEMPTGGHILPRDVDADGDLDILSLGNSGNRFVMLGNNDGTFGPAIFSSPINLHANWQTADINNDGRLDMLWTRSIASNQPAFIAISLGDGVGGFAPPTEITTPPFLGAVWTGDLSGDGAPELFVGVAAGVVGPLGYETVLVYPNNGDGTFGDYAVHAYDIVPNFVGGVGAFAWVDIDGDGDNDLLGISVGTFIYRNTNHQLEAPVPIAGFANYALTQFGPAIMDLDGDGDLDFYGAAGVGGVTSPAAFFNDGTGQFPQRSALMRYRNSTNTLAIGDADNNGRADILVKPEGFGDWYLHLNFASSVGDCNANETPDSCDIRAGFSTDADGDGVPDECRPADCGAGCRGDANCDGAIDFFDIDPFVMAIFDPVAYAALYCDGDTIRTDCNADGAVNFFDIDPFLSCLFAGCP